MKKIVLSLAMLSVAFLFSAGANSVDAQSTDKRATKFEIKKSEDLPMGGVLFVTVNGQEKKVADSALEAWIINDGREVVYADRDGAGGFENEGQSLRIYEVQYDSTRKILSEYWMISAVAEKKLSNGQTVLLVRMEDGGLGGSYFAVVDPRRGEVFYRNWAELLKIQGDTITLGFYRVDDWEKINEKRDWQSQTKSDVIPKPTKVRPVKTERHDLKMILKREVIYNRPSYIDDDIPDETKSKEVKIYFWRVNDEFENKNFVLSPVLRRVDKTAPLRAALETLFKGTTEDEEANGFGGTTFGMKFEGVVLKNGLARVKFSQPPNQTNYGSLGPFIFAAAIEKTARQFPTVKKVEICAVGETMIDSELDRQFPRCR